MSGHGKVLAALADSVCADKVPCSCRQPLELDLAKMFTYGGVTLGGLLGAYLPVILFHAGTLGIASLVGGTVGGFVGLWVGYKAFQYFGI